jgi:DNA-binding NarL/FixJ family response regulator
MGNFAIYSTNTVYRTTVEAMITKLGLKCLISESVGHTTQLIPTEELPDWVVVDVFSRGICESFLKELRNKYVTSKFVFLISKENQLANYFAIKFSVFEFLYVEDTKEDLIEHFSKILNSKSPKPLNSSNGLTMRECEVLRLIAHGKTSKEIAEELFISKNTVDTHRNKMLQKLNLSNSASLVTFACNTGLL